MFNSRSLQKMFAQAAQSLSSGFGNQGETTLDPQLLHAPTTFEPLEPRVLLSVSSPTPTTADSVYVATTDTTETQEDTLLAAALTETAAVDLAISISGTSLPQSVDAGENVGIRVPITIINNGLEMLRNKQMIDMAIYARPIDATDASADVLMVSFTGQLSKPLKSGESTTFYPLVELPGSLDAGEYRLVGEVDSTQQIAEGNENNNIAITTESIKIIDVNIDVEATLTNESLPLSVEQGQSASGVVDVQIASTGNTTTEDGAAVDITVVARLIGAADASGDIVLGTSTHSIAGIAPGMTATLSTDATLPSDAAAADYEIVALVDLTSAGLTSSASVVTAAGTAPLTVAEPAPEPAPEPEPVVIDLTVAMGSESLPTSVEAGQVATGNVAISVTNTGDAATTAGATVGITLVARPVGGSASDDIVLGSDSKSVAGLAAGATTTSFTGATLPADAAAGEYAILAIVDTTAAGLTTGGSVVTVGGDATIIVAQVATEPAPEPTITTDLTGAIEGENIASSTVSDGRTSFRLPVVVGNAGLEAMAADQLVDIAIYARPVDAADDSGDVWLYTAAGLSVANLQAGNSTNFNITTTLPRGLSTDLYRFVAAVDPANAINEADKNNNKGASASTVDVTEGYVELAASVDAGTVPTTIAAGTADAGELTTGVRNIGNLHTLGGTSVDVTIVARPVGATDSSGDIVLGSKLGNMVGYLYPDDVDQVITRLNMPAGVAEGDYQIVTIVDATNAGVGEGRPVVFEAVSASIVTVSAGAEAPSSSDGGSTGGDTGGDTNTGGDTTNTGDRVNELAVGEIVETTSTAIARWDVVPFQNFSGSFNVGVVAFHINGIDRVEFTVNGNAVGSVSEMTVNPPAPGVEEYWISLDGNAMADGQVTVDATVYPTEGTARVLSGDYFEANDNGEYGLVLFNNTSGSFERPVITIGPDDSFADALMTVADGGVIELQAGQYDIADMGGASRQFTRWVTIRPADGVSPDEVVIKPDVRKTIIIKGSKIQWQNLTFDFATIERLYPYKQDLHWFDNVTWTDSNGWATDYDRYFQPLHNFGHGFFTDSTATDMIYGPVAMQLVRNATVEQVSGDVFQNSVVVLNSTVNNVDNDILAHHSDIFQYWAPRDTRILENRIAFNVVGTDLNSQHFFMRTGGGSTYGESTFKDFAFVNIDLGMKDGMESRDKANQLYTNNTHVLFININEPHRFVFRGEGDALEGEAFVPVDVLFEFSSLDSISFDKLNEWTDIYTRENVLWTAG